MNGKRLIARLSPREHECCASTVRDTRLVNIIWKRRGALSKVGTRAAPTSRRIKKSKMLTEQYRLRGFPRRAAPSVRRNYFSVTSRMSLSPMISRISRRLTASWRCWSSVPTNLAPIASVLSRRPSSAAMFGYSIMSRIS